MAYTTDEVRTDGISAAAAKQGLAQKQPTTFSRMDCVVSDLAELNKRLADALGRLGHDQPCEEPCEAPSPLNRIGPDYSRSLRRIEGELSELRSNISALEQHI